MSESISNRPVDIRLCLACGPKLPWERDYPCEDSIGFCPSCEESVLEGKRPGTRLWLDWDFALEMEMASDLEMEMGSDLDIGR